MMIMSTNAQALLAARHRLQSKERSNGHSLFPRFRDGAFRCLKSDFRMRAVAKRFFGRCAATAQRHTLLGRIDLSFAVSQFHLTLYDVRPVLDDLDCYV